MDTHVCLVLCRHHSSSFQCRWQWTKHSSSLKVKHAGMRPLLIQPVFVFTNLVPSSQLVSVLMQMQSLLYLHSWQTTQTTKIPIPSSYPYPINKTKLPRERVLRIWKSRGQLTGRFNSPFFIQHTWILSHDDPLKHLNLGVTKGKHQCGPEALLAFPWLGSWEWFWLPPSSQETDCVQHVALWNLGYGQFVTLDSGS